uniref:Uncharacterized protein n=1 Tax=Timema bartmani TaxID=61472 RepID=A0A7R9ENR4_9NEOP|nr:unnamed protein product [Timema bartmani]
MVQFIADLTPLPACPPRRLDRSVMSCVNSVILSFVHKPAVTFSLRGPFGRQTGEGRGSVAYRERYKGEWHTRFRSMQRVRSVERDRLRERERQARAQMSLQAEREAEVVGGPFFGAPVKPRSWTIGKEFGGKSRGLRLPHVVARLLHHVLDAVIIDTPRWMASPSLLPFPQVPNCFSWNSLERSRWNLGIFTLICCEGRPRSLRGSDHYHRGRTGGFGDWSEAALGGGGGLNQNWCIFTDSGSKIKAVVAHEYGKPFERSFSFDSYSWNLKQCKNTGCHQFLWSVFPCTAIKDGGRAKSH